MKLSFLTYFKILTSLPIQLIIGLLVQVSSTVNIELKESHCPPDFILFPCSCVLSQIFCYNQNVVQLEPIFKRIVNYLTIRNIKTHFFKLELDGLVIFQLKQNFLQGLQFDEIALKNLRYLERIDEDAFNGTIDYLKQLSFEGETSHFITDANLNQINLAIRCLTKLERLYIDAHHLQTIPEYIFASESIVEISFNYNRIQKGKINRIESFAFYDLPKVNTIDLYDQNISDIGTDWFIKNNVDADFETGGESGMLWIYLQDNRLTDSSLQRNPFQFLQRGVQLYLTNNNITQEGIKIFKESFTQSSYYSNFNYQIIF